MAIFSPIKILQKPPPIILKTAQSKPHQDEAAGGAPNGLTTISNGPAYSLRKFINVWICSYVQGVPNSIAWAYRKDTKKKK